MQFSCWADSIPPTLQVLESYLFIVTLRVYAKLQDLEIGHQSKKNLHRELARRQVIFHYTIKFRILFVLHAQANRNCLEEVKVILI